MIQIRKATDARYYSVIVAANNADLYTSQMYAKKSNAKRAAQRAIDYLGNTIAETGYDYDALIVDKTV